MIKGTLKLIEKRETTDGYKTCVHCDTTKPLADMACYLIPRIKDNSIQKCDITIEAGNVKYAWLALTPICVGCCVSLNLLVKRQRRSKAQLKSRLKSQYDPLHRCYHNMKQRIYNKNNPDYKYYGGRGITMCPEWQNYGVFEEWALANGYKEGLTIDRTDNDKEYSPDNCSWISQAENSRKSATNTWAKLKESNNDRQDI